MQSMQECPRACETSGFHNLNACMTSSANMTTALLQKPWAEFNQGLIKTRGFNRGPIETRAFNRGI